VFCNIIRRGGPALLIRSRKFSVLKEFRCNNFRFHRTGVKEKYCDLWAERIEVLIIQPKSLIRQNATNLATILYSNAISSRDFNFSCSFSMCQAILPTQQELNHPLCRKKNFCQTPRIYSQSPAIYPVFSVTKGVILEVKQDGYLLSGYH
jgi:hypothetical protein